jgi:hypothetical protein
MRMLKIMLCFIVCPLMLMAWPVSFEQHELIPYQFDYNKCILKVKVDKWTKHNGKNVLPVTATLDNTSDDTLKYEMMTYYMLAFNIKNNNLQYEYRDEDILKNIPEFEIIPPHENKSYFFNLIKKDSLRKTNGSLKIGFCLVFPIYSSPSKDFYIHFEDPFAYQLDDKGKVIPHDNDLKNRTHLLWSDKIDLKSN